MAAGDRFAAGWLAMRPEPPERHCVGRLCLRCYHRHFGHGRSLTSSTVRDVGAVRAAAFTDRQFRDALAQFATGVAVICAPGPHGRFVGLTANSFNSVSLDPPLIVWSLNRSATSLAAFEKAERYAINVLAHDQTDLARRFSRPHVDRFEGVEFRLGARRRSADRRLRRMVRVPAPRAASCGRSRAVHRRGDDLRPQERRRARVPPRTVRHHPRARMIAASGMSADGLCPCGPKPARA